MGDQLRGCISILMLGYQGWMVSDELMTFDSWLAIGHQCWEVGAGLMGGQYCL